MRILVSGLIGQYPFGGVIWDYIQYVLGFRALGHEVYYLEDTGTWPYDPEKDTVTDDCSYHLRKLGKILAEFGLEDRWIYRNAADKKLYGLPETKAREVLQNADLLADVSALSWLEDLPLNPECHKMFLDGDPLFTQVTLLDPAKAEHAAKMKAYDSHFSFGLNLGRPDCLAPDAGIRWRPTIQPVDLASWPFAADPPLDRFTTVMNWASYKPKEWNGRLWGQKDLTFNDYLNLPTRTPQRMVLAMGQGIGRQRPTEKLLGLGWTILEPDEVLPDHRSYHAFLSQSKAEWSIAKHAYVQARTGWFSCRSACYLAAGRPVVVQDTAWTAHLPHGEGLLAFTTLEEAVEGIAAINRDYPKHRRAARAFAEEHLDGAKVCRKLLQDAGLA
jgi:hypothetical protein